MKLVTSFKDLNIGFKDVLIVFIGAMFSSSAVALFVRPAGLIPAGMSGTTMLITLGFQTQFNIELSYGIVYLVLNIVLLMFVVGKLGKKFLILSFLHIILTSTLIDILPTIRFTEDLILVAIFGGALNGIGSTITLRANGSTGGTDFIAIYFSMVKNKPQWDKIMIFNALLLIYSGWTYSWNIAFYSIIYQFVSTVIIDTYHNRYKLSSIHVVTQLPDEVSAAMLEVTRHGITKTDAIGVFKKKQTSMLYMVASEFEVNKIVRAIVDTDCKAFIEIATVDRIEGNYRQKPLD